ncbi:MULTISPECIES: sugar phosphate nucleotidyltransferase [Vibrio]|uniref:phosphocholine cytidylyltransferase family protein n=1 Tax=Vibrio TaxID=662 RepID=UPI000C82A843|nr:MULTISPECIES: phosphocholine cytidylyltransferase family protein [Vibrio]PMH18491.1 nucleotidyl transferase [Vibrio splendidus]PMI23374.1 nucleotidyl transferase [Vibrio sp. 10N.286.46.E10]
MTKALILAAGQGTRLRPITNDRPKCLVPLIGKSLLDRQVETLNAEDITDIHIATGYRADQIEALGFQTSFNERFKQTNMVESLFSAIEFIRSCKEDLILGYGDIVYHQENLKTLLACDDDIGLMVDKEWRALWSLRLENPLDDAETLVMDSEGYVIELGKKPESYERIQGQYTGLIKIKADKIPSFIAFYESLDRDVLYDGKNFDNMYMTSFIQMMIDDGWKVKAAIVSNGWLEVDSVEDLELYENMIKEKKLDPIFNVDELK